MSHRGSLEEMQAIQHQTIIEPSHGWSSLRPRDLEDIAYRPFTGTGLPVIVGAAPILIIVGGLLFYTVGRSSKK